MDFHPDEDAIYDHAVLYVRGVTQRAHWKQECEELFRRTFQTCHKRGLVDSKESLATLRGKFSTTRYLNHLFYDEHVDVSGEEALIFAGLYALFTRGQPLEETTCEPRLYKDVLSESHVRLIKEYRDVVSNTPIVF